MTDRSATLTQQWVCSSGSHCCWALLPEGRKDLVMTSHQIAGPYRQSFCCITRCISVSLRRHVCVNRPVIAATRIGLIWWTAAGVARLRCSSGDVTCGENKWTCMSKREMLKSRPIEIEKAYKFSTIYGSAVIPSGSTSLQLIGSKPVHPNVFCVTSPEPLLFLINST